MLHMDKKNVSLCCVHPFFVHERDNLDYKSISISCSPECMSFSFLPLTIALFSWMRNPINFNTGLNFQILPARLRSLSSANINKWIERICVNQQTGWVSALREAPELPVEDEDSQSRLELAKVTDGCQHSDLYQSTISSRKPSVSSWPTQCGGQPGPNCECGLVIKIHKAKQVDFPWPLKVCLCYIGTAWTLSFTFFYFHIPCSDAGTNEL